MRYRGFTFAMSDRGPVEILRGGRRVGEEASVSGARRFVRGWLRMERCG